MNRPLRGAAVLAAVLATASCTAEASQAHPSASAPSKASRTLPSNGACPAGTFHWGKITKQETLAAVSDPQELHIPAGKTVASTFDLVPVRTLTAAVTPSRTNDAVDPQAAVAALADETGLDLAKPGTTFTLSKGDKTLKTSSGKFDGVLVAAVGIDTVEASFVYGCGTHTGESVRGTLTTWSSATESGLFKCGIDAELPKAEAEALVCGERSST